MLKSVALVDIRQNSTYLSKQHLYPVLMKEKLQQRSRMKTCIKSQIMNKIYNYILNYLILHI